MSDPRPILIAAGGTGGHVYPALAIAERLRERGVPVVWLGTRNGMEASAVPAAGFPVEWVSVVGLRGKTLVERLLAPLRLLRACLQTWQVVSRHRPVGVLGMGGFVAAPGSLLAIVRRLPLILHEQNSVAGLTNKLFSRFATRIFTAFPNVLDGHKITQCVGNPVRKDVTEIAEPAVRLGERNDKSKPRLLVVGGSRGARVLNQTIPLALEAIAVECDVRHQCGVDDLKITTSLYSDRQIKADVQAFIDDMAAAYSWADLVVCRSGAMTVTELAAAGVASVLVPYPYAVDDHQTGNADWLSSADAAVLLPQSELDPVYLAGILEPLLQDRGRLFDMSVAARSLYRGGAAEHVADALQEVSL